MAVKALRKTRLDFTTDLVTQILLDAGLITGAQLGTAMRRHLPLVAISVPAAAPQTALTSHWLPWAGAIALKRFGVSA